MVEEKVKKREWVKNAAIIFLSIMLVLTFFSNTFMNYSLPEVSTKYVESGSINAKIRGSGTVAAAETYEVTYDNARKVETICVKIGQQVAAGDVLFILESADNSEEVQSLRDELEIAELNYEKSVLEAGKDKYTPQSRAVAEAREALREAEERLDRALNSTNSRDYYEKALAAATAARDAAANSIVSYDKDTVNLYKLIAEACYNYNHSSGNTQATWKQAFDSYYDQLNDIYISNIPDEQKAVAEPSAETSSGNEVTDTTPQDYDVLWGADLPSIAGKFSGAASKYQKLFNAEMDIVEAEKALASGSTSDSVEAAEAAVEAAEDAYDAARQNLSDAMENDDIEEKLEGLELKQALRNIEKLKEKINKLTSENDNEIVAKTAGVVSEINVAPGGMTGMGSPLAVLQLTDRGYTTSITVTAEQAKKVSVGDTAEVENYYWWGEEITAVLESIKTDPQSGGKSKILTFSVSGNVEPGTNLNLSLGQKSQNYEALVPNSAVRSDSNGSFVLVLENKSSPLGNRYAATRVDVKVLASDDVNSAVSGLSRGDYVITTASKPIESGTLVRMAEG